MVSLKQIFFIKCSVKARLHGRLIAYDFFTKWCGSGCIFSLNKI